MKYRIFCETENKYIENECFIAKEICPNDPQHVVKNGSLTVIANGYGTKDYKKQREDLREYVSLTGFANLPEEHKEVASKNFVVERADRDTIHTLEQQIEFGIEFHKKSIACRKERQIRMMAELYNKLSKSEYEEVITTMEENSLPQYYVDFGREGTEVGDEEGLYDYLQATSGTKFQETGLAAKNYSPVGTTMSGLVCDCMNIVKSGNY